MINSKAKGKVGKIIDLPNEKWLPVVGAEKYYQVSNLGRVKRVFCCAGTHVHLMKQNINPHNGYSYVCLSCNGKIRAARVHKLVMEAFCNMPVTKKYNKFATINHIDGNKQNNSLDNLEICTQSENQRKAYALGLQKVKGLKIICLDDMEVFNSATEAARHVGGHNGEMIARVCRGKRSHYRNFHFAFYDDYVNNSIPAFIGTHKKKASESLWR